jgi:hypothetical protein
MYVKVAVLKETQPHERRVADDDALLFFVSVAGDAPASSIAPASVRRPRLARPKTDGGEVTLTELMRLSKIELCDLLARITNALPEFAEGSVERANALLNLGNIRWVLAPHDDAPTGLHARGWIRRRNDQEKTSKRPCRCVASGAFDHCSSGRFMSL